MHDDENLAIYHAYDYEACFVVIFPIIQELHRKRVVEHTLGQFKTDSVFGEIVLAFGFIPFECQISMLRDISSIVKRPEALVYRVLGCDALSNFKKADVQSEDSVRWKGKLYSKLTSCCLAGTSEFAYGA